MAEKKQFTRNQVEKDNGNGKTLIILHDKVYDVSSFLNEHPGGEEILLDHAGKDASEDFDDVGHSVDAFGLMKTYHVGEIVESERRNKLPKKGWMTNSNSQQPEKPAEGSGISFNLLLAGFALLIIALVYLNA